MYEYACSEGHKVELSQSDDGLTCPYIYGHCKERGHEVNLEHHHTMFQCGKVLVRIGNRGRASDKHEDYDVE